MRYVDFDGNDHVMNESQSIGILSDDGRCRWGFNKNGSASLNIDNQEVVNIDVQMELEEGKWVPIPYRPVKINKILYRKTYAVKEWLVNTGAHSDTDQVITDKDTKWEIGMNLKTRIGADKVKFLSRIQVPVQGEAQFEVWSNKPVRVRVKTNSFDRTFERNGPQLLKFSVGIY